MLNDTHDYISYGISLESGIPNGMKKEPHGMFYSKGHETHVQMLPSTIRDPIHDRKSSKSISRLTRGASRVKSWSRCQFDPDHVNSASRPQPLLTRQASLACIHTWVCVSACGHTRLELGFIIFIVQKMKLRHTETSD